MLFLRWKSDQPRLTLVAGALLTAMAGCYATGGVGYPAEFIDMHRPTRIWITETNDSSLAVDVPRMHGDTLVGYVGGAYRELPIADVKFVRARLLDPGRTAVLVGVASLAVAAAVVNLARNDTKSGANICFNGADQQVPCP